MSLAKEQELLLWSRGQVRLPSARFVHPFLPIAECGPTRVWCGTVREAIDMNIPVIFSPEASLIKYRGEHWIVAPGVSHTIPALLPDSEDHEILILKRALEHDPLDLTTLCAILDRAEEIGLCVHHLLAAAVHLLRGTGSPTKKQDAPRFVLRFS